MAKRKQTTIKFKDLQDLSLMGNVMVNHADNNLSERGSLEETVSPIASATEIPKNLNYAGILIANKARPENKGTLGGIFVSDKGELYGTTCLHVVKQNENYTTFLPDESFKVISEDAKEIGFFNENLTVFNSKLDVALIKLSGKFHNKTIDSPTQFVELKKADIGTEVYFFNERTKKKVKGFIVRVEQKGNWISNKFENMIFVADNMDEELCQAITDKGDSGSWLLRVADNSLLGIIIFNSLRFTFVMPITDVLEAFKKKKINLMLNLLPE
jgi:hypothetical protein